MSIICKTLTLFCLNCHAKLKGSQRELQCNFHLRKIPECGYLHGTHSPRIFPMASYAVPARSHWFQLVPVVTGCPNRLPLLFCFCQGDFPSFPKQKFAKTILNGCPIYFRDQMINSVWWPMNTAHVSERVIQLSALRIRLRRSGNWIFLNRNRQLDFSEQKHAREQKTNKLTN